MQKMLEESHDKIYQIIQRNIRVPTCTYITFTYNVINWISTRGRATQIRVIRRHIRESLKTMFNSKEKSLREK